MSWQILKQGTITVVKTAGARHLYKSQRVHYASTNVKIQTIKYNHIVELTLKLLITEICRNVVP